jgi:RNA polymerase sigma factor (sigma-70 family)
LFIFGYLFILYLLMKSASLYTKFKNYSEQELLHEMLKNEDAFNFIYLKCKEPCINFMKKMNANVEDAIDIYQDATIVLYEKIQNKSLKLTVKIETYLTSICKYQLLSRFNNIKSKNTILEENLEEKNDDWFEEENESNTEKMNILLKEFDILKTNNDKCYERLRLFYYENLSMKEIAIKLTLKDDKTAKNLVNRCRDNLKIKVGA